MLFPAQHSFQPARQAKSMDPALIAAPQTSAPQNNARAPATTIHTHASAQPKMTPLPTIKQSSMSEGAPKNVPGRNPEYASVGKGSDVQEPTLEPLDVDQVQLPKPLEGLQGPHSLARDFADHNKTLEQVGLTALHGTACQIPTCIFPVTTNLCVWRIYCMANHQLVSDSRAMVL